MNDSTLVEFALDARKNAYAPYSGFTVGAAILAKNGKVYTGCNIENSSYGATNCAERTAIFKAVSEGVTEFEKIAVVGGMKEDDETKGFGFPCGICRQVMREFCNPAEFKVIVAKSVNEYQAFLLEDLLPFSFGPENIY